MKKSELIFTGILVPLDFCMLVSAGLFAYFLRTNPIVVQYRPVLFSLNLPFGRYFSLVLGVSLFLIIVFALIGLYRIKIKRQLLDDFLKVLIGVSAGIMGIVFYIFLRQELFNSRFLLLAGWFLAIGFVFLGRFLISQLQKYLLKKFNFGIQRVLLVGRDGFSQKIQKYFKNRSALGYQLVSTLIEPDIEEIKNKVQNPGVEQIILADPDWPREKIIELVNFCEENHLSFKFVPNLFQTLTSNTAVETLGNVPMVELKRTALDGWGRIIKGIIDFIGALIGLVILSPVFFLIAFLIKWDSAGPVFAKLKRVSQGQEFNLYKFRSMIQGAHDLRASLMDYNQRQDGPLFKMKNDPRITRVGRILRKYRIDELPQLINVLNGEMSLIGPRPHEPEEIAQYQKHHKKVLAIKSGMTGFAQVSGSSDLPFEEEIKLDTFYIENWSLLMDLKIFLKTLIFVLCDRSAC